MTNVQSKHPLAVRMTHWLNVVFISTMIWSGLVIYWAYDPYQISIAGFLLFKFFPDWFYDSLDLKYGLAIGMAYHFTFMWFFTINGLVYVVYVFASGYWRHLKPDRHTPKHAFWVMLHDLHLRKTLPPQGIFNAAQKTRVVFK